MHPDPFGVFEFRLMCLDEYFARPLLFGIYDVAAWLGQLLLDATPLVDVVNRELRVKIRDEVNTLPDALTADLREGNALIHLGGSLSPALTRLPTKTRHLTRDQFLQEPILLTGHERITTQQLILWAANEAGGVHYDPKDEGTTVVLNRLMRAVDREDHRVLASTIIGIARVVRDALEPLRVAIEAREA
jgi:hypothetical protein